jgi:membrane protein implicated in regulation of membrane protease activity
MTEPSEGGGGRRPVVTLPLVMAGVCLAVPFAAMLWVGSYARLTPAFIGIPFFYWYQMLWVVISTLLTTVAYVLVRRHERARKGGSAR